MKIATIFGSSIGYLSAGYGACLFYKSETKKDYNKKVVGELGENYDSSDFRNVDLDTPQGKTTFTLLWPSFIYSYLVSDGIYTLSGKDFELRSFSPHLLKNIASRS